MSERVHPPEYFLVDPYHNYPLLVTSSQVPLVTIKTK